MGQEKKVGEEKKKTQKKEGRRHSLVYFFSWFFDHVFLLGFFFHVWCMYDRSHLLHTNGVFCWLNQSLFKMADYM